MQIIMGLIGMVVLLAIAVLLSSNRKAINLRTVLGAWIIQVGIGALILYVPAGRTALLAMSNGVANVIAYGNEGIGFIFGGLVSDKMFEVFGGGGFVFALRVLPVIVFFSSLIAVLYYLGIMQFVIRILGGALRAVLKTSRTESLSATANGAEIFSAPWADGLPLIKIPDNLPVDEYTFLSVSLSRKGGDVDIEISADIAYVFQEHARATVQRPV